MVEDRTTPVDQVLNRIDRTSEVGSVVSELEQLLNRARVLPINSAPLASLAAEHVRERRIADRDPETGLRGTNSLQRALREAWRTQTPPLVPLCLRIGFSAPRSIGAGGAGGTGQPGEAPRSELLRALATALRDNVSMSDLVAQTGEQELAVLMSRVDPQHAPGIASRLDTVCKRAAVRVQPSASVDIQVLVLNDPGVGAVLTTSPAG